MCCASAGSSAHTVDITGSEKGLSTMLASQEKTLCFSLVAAVLQTETVVTKQFCSVKERQQGSGGLMLCVLCSRKVQELSSTTGRENSSKLSSKGISCDLTLNPCSCFQERFWSQFGLYLCIVCVWRWILEEHPLHYDNPVHLFYAGPDPQQHH